MKLSYMWSHAHELKHKKRMYLKCTPNTQGQLLVCTSLLYTQFIDSAIRHQAGNCATRLLEMRRSEHVITTHIHILNTFTDMIFYLPRSMMNTFKCTQYRPRLAKEKWIRPTYTIFPQQGEGLSFSRPPMSSGVAWSEVLYMYMTDRYTLPGDIEEPRALQKRPQHNLPCMQQGLGITRWCCVFLSSYWWSLFCKQCTWEKPSKSSWTAGPKWCFVREEIPNIK